MSTAHSTSPGQPPDEAAFLAGLAAASRLLLDDPLDVVTAADELGRLPYVQAVVGLIERASAPKRSLVFGLIAEWGSGKSTVMASLIQQLELSPSRWLVAQCNPWMYSDLGSLVEGFFGELRAVLPREDRWNNTRENLGKFAKTVAPLGGFGNFVGFDVSKVIEKGGQFLAGDSSASGLKAKAEKSLAESDRPILMVLDDLDRLDPSELLTVFKLVRLVGRLPNVYYVLSYDEDTLIDSLSRTELAYGDRQRAQDYLEKIVQVRLDLPPMRDDDIARMFDARLNTMLVSHEIELTSDDVKRLRRLFGRFLLPRLRTPRSIQRLVAQLHATFTPLRHEVNVVDFLTLTFLRTEFPLVYQLLPEHRAELTMQVGPDGPDEPGEIEQRWEKLIAQRSPTSHVGTVMSLLGDLFVPLGLAVNPRRNMATMYQAIHNRRGPGSADYFDRYFNFAVPLDDIGDLAVLRALVDLSTGAPSPRSVWLQQVFAERNMLVVSKVIRHPPAATAAADQLLTLSAASITKVMEGEEASLVLDPLSRVASLCAALLSRYQDASAACERLREMAVNTDAVQLVAHAAMMLSHGTPEGDHSAGGTEPDLLGVVTRGEAWVASVISAASTVVAEHLESFDVSSSPTHARATGQIGTFFALRELDKERADAWLRRVTQDGGWSLLDAIAVLTPSMTPVGLGSDAGSHLGDLDLKLVDEVFGVDSTLEVLSRELASFDAFPSQRLADTETNRRRWVLTALSSEQRRRLETEQATNPT